MKILDNKQECCGCFSCYNSCPVNAIEIKVDDEGFKYPVVKEDSCIHCNKCKQTCPVLKNIDENSYEEAYIAYAIDYEERMCSSSGGAFAVFAKEILKNGGVVCGARYNQNMEVEHGIVSTIAELQQLKGTKYVQSDMSCVYKEIKTLLKANIKVLFSGTPCQVAGLKSFLGKEYEGLTCIDLICHGVPSPEVWKDYLKNISGSKKIKFVNFRLKNIESKTVQIAYYLDDDTFFLEDKNESLYMKGFMRNLFIRPSCFNCKFKGCHRMSDITLGDFWSAKEFYEDIADDYGNSAIVVRTKKGQDLLEDSKKCFVLRSATMKEVVTWNESFGESVKYDNMREEFYKYWRKESLLSILKELTNKKIELKEKNLFSRIKKLIGNIINL